MSKIPANEYMKYDKFIKDAQPYDRIKQLPPVHPERPSDEWIITYPFGLDNPIYECPKCRASNNSVFKNFCPNCGTDLREGEKNESCCRDGRA